MKIAWSKTREQFPLSTKKILKKTLVITIAWAILLCFMGGVALLTLLSTSLNIGSFIGFITLVILVLLLLMIFVVYLYQRWYYAVYFYDLTPDFIVIKKGPITPHEITVPYQRLQDVYVDQDIFDRIFGLYDVHVSSATVSSGEAAHIDGLEKVAADGLRAILLETISKGISKKLGSRYTTR